MPALHTLDLRFAPTMSVTVWSQIANGSATNLSTLRELRLFVCHMDMRDFSKILSNVPSLTCLFLGDLHLYDGFREDFSQVLLRLANRPCELETFTLDFGGVSMGEHEEIIFPSSLQKPDAFPYGEAESEDEWVLVEIQHWIYWKGKEDIKWVLKEMAAHVQSL